MKISSNTLVLFHFDSILHMRVKIHASWQIVGDSGFPNVCDICSVSVANSFVHPQSANDSGYHSFGESARFVYFLLQNIKLGSSLPLVEQ